MAIGQEFQGLPMADLIGSPLSAACDANLKLAKATADFINTVGFETDKDGNKTIRNADFLFNRPVITYDGDGKQVIQQEKVSIDVPLLTIVQVPSLKVDSVDVMFDMEIKSSEKIDESKSSSGTLSGSAGLKIGLFNASVNFKGNISAHKDNTRQTDKSAKYHVEVKASDHGMPEGLARVLDLMNQAIAPTSVEPAAKVVNKSQQD